MLARGFWGILFGPLGEKEEKGRMGKRKKRNRNKDRRLDC